MDKQIIVVTVMGGVVDVELPENLSKNVEVQVLDYDVEGYDETELKEDANGDLCHIREFGNR